MKNAAPTNNNIHLFTWHLHVNAYCCRQEIKCSIYLLLKLLVSLQVPYIFQTNYRIDDENKYQGM